MQCKIIHWYCNETWKGTPELARRGGNAIAAGGCSDNVKSKRSGPNEAGLVYASRPPKEDRFDAVAIRPRG
jgi:hypothetical protein